MTVTDTTWRASTRAGNYMLSLARERRCVPLGDDADSRVARARQLLDGGLSPRSTSEWITRLQGAPRDVATSASPSPNSQDLEPGVYEVAPDEVYVVKRNREKTRVYAKRMVEVRSDRLNGQDDMVRVDFEYAPGAITKIRPEHRMDVDRAKALTIRYGKCIVCGRGLKVGQSVERGIGPVCIKYFRA